MDFHRPRNDAKFSIIVWDDENRRGTDFFEVFVQQSLDAEIIYDKTSPAPKYRDENYKNTPETSKIPPTPKPNLVVNN